MLIIVLWIAIGMISIALYFANSMTYELRASDNRVSGVAADQAIEGAARYVGYVLYNYATNGAVPLTNQYQAAAVPVGDAHFWFIGHDPRETSVVRPLFRPGGRSIQVEFEHCRHQHPHNHAKHDSGFCGRHRGLAQHQRLGLYSLDYNSPRI